MRILSILPVVLLLSACGSEPPPPPAPPPPPPARNPDYAGEGTVLEPQLTVLRDARRLEDQMNKDAARLDEQVDPDRVQPQPEQ